MERVGIPVPSLHIALLVAIILFLSRMNYRIFYAGAYTQDYFHVGEIYESNVEVLLLVLGLEYVAWRKKAHRGEI